MRHGRRLVVAMLLAMSVPVYADAKADGGMPSCVENTEREAVRPSKPDGPLGRAYEDAVRLLEDEGSCSHFFGGKNAEAALERLAAQLRRGMLGNSHVGIRMSGVVTFHGRPGEVSYRLFAEAVINTAGPFYKAKAFPTDPFVPNVGGFHPNTREARVLMLLHELAHLLEGPDGTWLIPDDAGNSEQSARNTARVESQCREQILSL
jgi:hypothetical protein